MKKKILTLTVALIGLFSFSVIAQPPCQKQEGECASKKERRCNPEFEGDSCFKERACKDDTCGFRPRHCKDMRGRMDRGQRKLAPRDPFAGLDLTESQMQEAMKARVMADSIYNVELQKILTPEQYTMYKNRPNPMNQDVREEPGRCERMFRGAPDDSNPCTEIRENRPPREQFEEGNKEECKKECCSKKDSKKDKKDKKKSKK
jgi:hypothetical protein